MGRSPHRQMQDLRSRPVVPIDFDIDAPTRSSGSLSRVFDAERSCGSPFVVSRPFDVHMSQAVQLVGFLVIWANVERLGSGRYRQLAETELRDDPAT